MFFEKSPDPQNRWTNLVSFLKPRKIRFLSRRTNRKRPHLNVTFSSEKRWDQVQLMEGTENRTQNRYNWYLYLYYLVLIFQGTSSRSSPGRWLDGSRVLMRVSSPPRGPSLAPNRQAQSANARSGAVLESQLAWQDLEKNHAADLHVFRACGHDQQFDRCLDLPFPRQFSGAPK